MAHALPPRDAVAPGVPAPVQIGHYRLGKTLGIGSFGKVKLATHVVTGHQVAIKILNRGKIRSLAMEDKVRREISILRMLRHPHIIRIYDVVETPSDIFLIMEYLSHGEIFDLVVSRGRLAAEDARQVFHQLISGVEFLHYKRVIHRDLKPENLLLDENLNIKIADFGLSNIMRDGEFLRTSCGSPNYAAPEIISGSLYAGPEVDVWSCGVILYALLCGTLPFDDENIPVLFKKIKACEYTLPSHLSELSRDLIQRMLTVDPIRRITIPEVRQHAWFQLNLPHYLSQGPRLFDTEQETVDEDIVEDVMQLPIAGGKNTRERVLEAINSMSRRLTDLRVAYHLALDHKSRRRHLQELREATAGATLSPPTFSPAAQTPSSLLLSPVLGGASVGGGGGGGGGALPTPPDLRLDGGAGAVPAAGGATPQEAADPSRLLAPTPGVLPTSAAGALTQPSEAPTTVQLHYVRRRRWYLGIQSKKEPAHVMTEVYKALYALRCDWRIVSSYRLICRWAPSGKSAPGVGQLGHANASEAGALALAGAGEGGAESGEMDPNDCIKISLQLYKVQNNIYLLDFHKVAGDAFSFMGLCARIITELKTLSASSRLAAQQAAAAQAAASPSSR